MPGELWGWRNNTSGRLGLGFQSEDVAVPTRVGEEDWLEVSPGVRHTLAIRADGTLWAWGAGSSGELGQGNQFSSHTPLQVGVDTWIAISAGGFYSLGIKSDGTLWAWGYNSDANLGLNDTTQRTSPVQVGSDSTWVKVAAGHGSSFGLKSDGTLWAWGKNDYGQLGLGDTSRKYIPTRVGAFETSWASISAGPYHTAATKTDGTLWTWGAHWGGMLGVGTWVTSRRTNPTQVAGTDWDSVSAGNGHTVARKTNGTIWAFGAEYVEGTLGLGATTETWEPMQIGASSDWKSVKAGTFITIALANDGTLYQSGIGGQTTPAPYNDGVWDQAHIAVNDGTFEAVFAMTGGSEPPAVGGFWTGFIGQREIMPADQGVY